MVVTRVTQKFGNIRFDHAEADIPVELLPPLVEQECRAAFNAQSIGILVVGRQPSVGDTAVHAVLDFSDIGAERLGDFALDLPTGNVATIAKKGMTQPYIDLFEQARFCLLACLLVGSEPYSSSSIAFKNKCALADDDGRVLRQISG